MRFGFMEDFRNPVNWRRPFPDFYEQILNQIMVVSLNDVNQSWEMDKDGNYHRLRHDRKKMSAHDYFMKNPSLSGRGQSLNKAKPKVIPLFDN